MKALDRVTQLSAPVLLVVLLLAGCQALDRPDTPPTPSGNLEATTWQLVSYLDSRGQTREVIPETRITAIFEAGSLSGEDGCNRIFASYQAGSGQIKIEPGGSTLIACSPEDIAAQAADFQLALSSASSYSFDADRLILGDVQGQVLLTFEAVPPSAGALEAPAAANLDPLAGSRWQAVSYQNTKQAAVGVLPGTEITLLFGESGDMNGSAGCNHYSGTYRIDQSAIQIDPAAMTRKICPLPQGEMEQEAIYIGTIQRAAAFQLNEETLTLLDANNSPLVRYVRR